MTETPAANGAGGFFHNLYTEAVNGSNGFAARFYGWRSRPGRSDAWYETGRPGLLIGLSPLVRWRCKRGHEWEAPEKDGNLTVQFYLQGGSR